MTIYSEGLIALTNIGNIVATIEDLQDRVFPNIENPPTLCNGTRLIVKKLLPNVIEATISTGQSAGKDVFILRIPHIPSDVPFQFKRIQFPVKLSFGMSINKSQGQSLKVVEC
ncbi:uncharacterized protein LOC129971824 [Argiope bruennichi]|uniref:uncharacterized protein LOC129971824 n=1 Tax=Argiope bruennichi TaxID=94029 RepID=UPI0024941BBC|nr:uncharacterized protein LOC129971824 [Argiope bruennichi]